MALNEASEKKLAGVKPDLVRVCRRAAEISTQPFQIVQGNRTQAEQNALYAQGRTKPGQVVTWTKNSKHIGGGAIDFAALVGGRINWQEKYYPPIAAAFKKAASEAGIGIAWGGDWKTKDWGHIELIASSAPAPVTPAKPAAPKPRQTLKKGMTGGDVPVLQKRLKELGYYSGLIDGDFGPQTLKSLLTAQEALGLKKDGVCGPATWKALFAAPGPALPAEQSKNWPQHAIEYFLAGGLPPVSAAAFAASFIWESGGNQEKPPTIKWDAVGDNGNSIGAGQWNKAAGRQKGLLDLAFERGKPHTDPDTQLAYALQELRTTEKRAHAALMAAKTIEDANEAAISYWRPSVPHAEKRLAIAKTLYAKLTDAVRAAG